jgi:cell division protein FtsW
MRDSRRDRDRGSGRGSGNGGRSYDSVDLEPLDRSGGGRASDRLPAARPLPVRPPAMGPNGGPKREVHDPDWVIAVAVVALAAVGILMVYSASAIDAYKNSRNTFQMVAPQIGAGLAGLLAMILLARIDYRYMRKVSLVLAIVSVVLLVAVLIPGIGVRFNYATRWIRLGPLFEIHPAEVAKLALVVYLAHWLTTKGSQIKTFFRGTVPFWIIVFPFVVLVAREPDIGTTSIILIIALVLFFVAGASLFHLGMAFAGGAAGGVLMVMTVGSYAMKRVEVFFNPWADPLRAGYHTIKGLEALAAGGLFGTGLGNDKVIVPQDYNDFIFSIIAQELGFVGGVVVIGLFVALAWAGIRTSLRAPDTFGGLLAAGITAWIAFQAFINICVVLALVPVTGITLPFVSQGGSSLVVSFAAAGILLSISRETVEGGWVNASADRGRGYGRTYIPGRRRGSIAAGSTDGS